jgi:dUTP pyrophosphatase
MKSMIKVQLDDGAFMPERAHELDAGMDLRTPVRVTVPAHGYVFVDTGVHMEVPAHLDAHVRSKSGLNRWHGITADGTVDSGYTGGIGVTLHNDSDDDYFFKRGDEVAQVVFEVITRPRLVLVDRITKLGDRGDNGYGSSGR